MFPYEIWEEILRHMGAEDLLRLRRVSRDWKKICDYILKKEDPWYKQCKEDIPEIMLSSLMEHRNNLYMPRNCVSMFENVRHFSQKMYKSWRGWRSINKTTQTKIHKFEPLPFYRTQECITCIAALSDIVAIGTTEGYLLFYNMLSRRVFYKVDLTEFVVDLQLFKIGEVLFCVSLSIHQRIKFWDVMSQSEDMNLRRMGTLITPSYITCHLNGVHGSAMCILLKRPDNLSGTKPLLRQVPACVTYLSVTFMTKERIVVAGVDHNEIIMYTENGRVIRLTCEDKSVLQADTQLVNRLPAHIRCYKFFKPRIIAFIAMDGGFGLSVDNGEWKTYELFYKFGAPVTSIVFHVSLLGLGLQSGEVHLFHIEDIESLKNLDFDTMVSLKLTLDSKAINSLRFTEYNSSQYLVASSHRQMHVVMFK